LEKAEKKITPYLWQRRGGEKKNCRRYAWRDWGETIFLFQI